MADDVDFDPSQAFHYRGGGEIPLNVRLRVIRVAIDPSVEEIRDRLFMNCQRLEEVTFGEGLLKIGARAFAHCFYLRSFRSPSTVTEIGEGAFNGCSSLTVAELPPGLASIEDGTFLECQRLKEIRIPHSVARIGDQAFCNCRSLRKFRTPLSVIEIGRGAFYGCSSLALLRLHEDLLMLGQIAFRGCPLESFRFACLSERREAIALDARANSELEGMLNEIVTVLVGDSPNARECQEILRRAHGVLTDSLRENTTTLELALWKKKIDEEAERDPRPSRQECRTNSGADMNIVIGEVLTFIPSPWS